MTEQVCAECGTERHNPLFDGRDCLDSTDGYHVWVPKDEEA